MRVDPLKPYYRNPLAYESITAHAYPHRRVSQERVYNKQCEVTHGRILLMFYSTTIIDHNFTSSQRRYHLSLP